METIHKAIAFSDRYPTTKVGSFMGRFPTMIRYSLMGAVSVYTVAVARALASETLSVAEVWSLVVNAMSTPAVIQYTLGVAAVCFAMGSIWDRVFNKTTAYGPGLSVLRVAMHSVTTALLSVSALAVIAVLPAV